MAPLNARSLSESKLRELKYVYPAVMRSAKDSKAKTKQPASAMEAISAEERERFESILNFWHKIEFFIPFDLDQRIAEQDEHKVRFLHR